MDLSAFSSSVNYGTLSPADEVKEMDEIIRQHTYEIIALKVQRNTRVPIYCLPTEVMAEVFLWVKKMVEQDFSEPNSTLAWIGVSHVCCSWREIAVNLAELWTAIPLWNAPWTDEMIKRSRQAPLIIKYKFGADHYSLPLLKQALDRPNVQEISIDSMRMEHADLIPTGLIQLERLTISGMAGINSHLCLPAEILSKATKLVKLDLSYCTMDWISYLPSSVTVLKLSNIQTPSPLPLSRLIDALETLQSLKVLKLDDVMESFEIGGDSSLHRVKLHRIRQLTTISSVDKALIFFHYITFSPDIQLAIHTMTTSRGPSSFVNSIRKLFTSIGNVYANWSSDTTFALLMIHKGYELDGESLSLALMSPPGYLLPSLAFNIAMNEETAFHSGDLLAAMLDSGLPVQNINQISFGGFEQESEISFEGSFLAQTLNRLPGISYIRTDDKSFNLALDIIRYPTAGSSEELCFPNLSTLGINGVNFALEDETKVFSLLKSSLLFRCESNAEINKLVLQDCMYTHSDRVALLRKIVANVIWDGIVDPL